MSRKTAAEQRQKDKDIAAENWRAFQRAWDSGHEDYVREAKKFNKFYVGDQWEQADIDKLESEGRPHLTINLIMKVVNAYLAEHKKLRADIEFRPRRDTTTDMSVLMSKLVEQILENNTYEYVEREVLSDGLVQDRGYIDVRLNFDDNVYGDIQITPEDPNNIIPDPDSSSYDPEDWNEVFRFSWMTLDEIEAAYGKDKKDMVEACVRSGEFELTSENIRFDGTRTFGNEERYTPAPDAIDRRNATIRCVRVVERQWRRLTRVRHFVDLETGDTSEVPHDISDERVEEMVKEFGLGLTERMGKRVRWTVTTLDVKLHDDWSIYRSFTIIPYFPYFRKGRASGVVRQLISPQEQHNKYESQMLHVVNTSANSGWIMFAGSLVNMTKDELEARGSESGLVIEVAPGAQPPAKIQPNQIPTGLDRIAERTRASVSEISGIDPVVGDAQESTVQNNQILSQQIRNMVQIQVPFDTLNLTRKYLGRKVLECVQDFYTEPRILRVTNWEDLNRPAEEVPINYIDAAGQLVNNLAIGEYDLMVSSKPARDSYQAAQFSEALEMRQAGVMVPDDVVIRQSNLEDKFNIADKVASLTGTADPTPEEMEMGAMMQQLQMAGAQAEVQKLQAEAMELQARAQEQFAKAQYLEGQEQREAIELGAKYQQSLADMNLKLQMQLNDLSNKIELAKIHSGSKKEMAMLDSAVKGLSNEVQNRTNLDIARINASSRANQSTGSK